MSRAPKVETRADVLGVKLKTLRSRTRRDLAKVQRLLEGLAYDWSELESGYANDVESLYRLIALLDGETLDASLEHLAQPWDSAE